MDRRLITKSIRRDKIARWAITASGMVIIISVIGILVLIVQVALPLFFPAGANVANRFQVSGVSGDSVWAVDTDEYLETGYALTRRGEWLFFDSHTGKIIGREAIPPPRPRATPLFVEPYGVHTYTMLWSDHTFTVEQVGFSPQFDGESRRTIGHATARLISLGWPRGLAPPVKGWVRMNPEGEVTRVALLADGRLYFTRRATQTDFMGETTTQTTSAFLEGQPGDVWNAAALDEAGHTLYGAASTGDLVGWDLSGESPRMTGRVKAAPVGRAIHTLNWVFGDISLVVADDRGEVSTWFTTPGQDGRPRLTRIHSLEVHPGPVETIIPSRTDKTVLTLDQAGGLYFDHPTSERHLLTLQSRDPVLHAGFSTRGNGLITLDAKGWLTLWNVRNPHPEVSFQSLFGKVWYESYPEPAYVWQSSSASSDFEPKLSLVPLIFGTLKATFYAMLFATPLAIFGAVYTSQLLHPKLHKYIKPTVEVMSAVPTVVIGFLAALWLAPLMEHHLLIPMVFLGVLPLAVVGATWLWAKNAHRPRLKRLGTGYEFVFAIPVLLLAFGVSIWLGGWLEQGFFDGDFRQWHFQTSGTRVDQRNSIIIAFALGFAIIPTIFTIAEDALSNVPAKLTAASLALGASRWQTVWRVVVPSASPGIFAGVMIGFGRAVGETMIVLMATGNTPIMDGSIFNGMRTLSANIAVEIPEAPVSGTLYRVLFLSAVLLFCSTFLFNSIAEVVRHRLRKKYGRF